MMDQEKPAPMKSLLKQFVGDSLLVHILTPKNKRGLQVDGCGVGLPIPKKPFPKSQWPGGAQGEGLAGAGATLSCT